ncbi:MAG TPA: LamG-like jellyroll fold domain-containing protein [Phycisphaerae bacterium]|nr:LamG-like jellyroll fold domain-containing protein [Phycisphaerae bacterium]
MSSFSRRIPQLTAAVRNAAVLRYLRHRPDSLPPMRAEPLEQRSLFSAPGTGWNLTFDDEFNGSSLDTTKWANYLPWNNGSTGDNRFEGGSYVDYMVNANTTISGVNLTSDLSLSGGQLHLKTQQTATFTVGSQSFNYTGAMITTGINPFRTFSSGYFEIRAQLPTGAGNWPAFWMTNGWPPEDDIMEAWPGQPRFHQGLYGMDNAWHDYNDTTSATVPSTNWHTYALEWGPGYQKFYVDNAVTYSTTTGVPTSANPEYLLLNSSVASGQTGSYSNANNNSLNVDYVRIYTYNAATTPSIANAGFNTTGSWNFTNANATIVIGSTIGLTGTGDLHVAGAGEANQNITGLSPNTTYSLTAYAVVATGSTAGLLGVRSFSAGSGNVSVAAGNPGAVGTWVQSSVTFTTGPSDTSAQIYLSNLNSNAVYFDDTQLATPAILSPIANLGTAVGTPRSTTFSITQGQAAGFWSASASSANQSLVANANLTVTGSGSSRTLTIAPQPGVTGTTAITVTITDAFGDISTKTFNLTVGSTSDPTSPTVANPATANPSPITGTSTALSVLGADNTGESGLTYTWWVGAKPTGASDPTFTNNSSNAAKNTTVNFSMAGSYQFGVQITDANGFWTTSSVSVNVNATPTSVSLSPNIISVGVNTSQQFSASVLDQFSQIIASPILSWSLPSGGGSLLASGLYTAPSTPGTATIKVTSGNASAIATANVIPISEELDWYPANEFSGNFLNDNSGHDRTASLSGSYSFSSGKLSNALNLSGGYASLPTGLLSSTTEFSISTWVNLTSLATWSRIFDFGTGTTNYMFLSPQAGGTNLPRFAILTPGSGTEQRIDSSTAISTGVWTNIAVTLSGTNATLYINGVNVGSNANMTLNPASLGITNLNYLGKSQFPDPALSGSIDDFRIYNRALTQSQIQSLVSGNPFVSLPAAASPSPTTSTTANLSVLADDDTGEANLTYSWSASGPAPVAFSTNGTNASKNVTASFSSAGTYTLTATVTDAQNHTVTSNTTLTVGDFVSNLNDSGPGSLRQAILDTNASTGTQIIAFTPGLSGTISLSSPLPTPTNNLILQSTNITLDGAGTLLTIPAGINATIQDLTLTTGSLDNEGSLQILGNDLLNLLTGNGTLTIGTATTAATLTLATLPGATSSQSALTLNPGSTFDIADQSFLLTYGPGNTDSTPTIIPQLAAAQSANWTTGLISSLAAANPLLAIGFADNTATGQLTLKTTLFGDANLDGHVDLSDLSTVLNNFGSNSTNWSSGNFQYASTVNLSDLSYVLNNFGQSMSSLGYAASTPPATTQSTSSQTFTPPAASSSTPPTTTTPDPTTPQTTTLDIAPVPAPTPPPTTPVEDTPPAPTTPSPPPAPVITPTPTPVITPTLSKSPTPANTHSTHPKHPTPPAPKKKTALPTPRHLRGR